MAYIDIGHRVKGYRIAAEALDGHALRVYKSGTVYGIPLVDPSVVGASPVRIYDGAAVKALAMLPFEYNGADDYEPDNVNLDFPWTKSASGTYDSSVDSDGDCDNGKRLTIDTPTNDTSTLYYTLLGSGTPFANINNANGYVIECRLKLIDGGGDNSYGFMIHCDDGTYQWQFRFTPSGSRNIWLTITYITETHQYANIDLTDAYHLVRIEVTGTSIVLKVDGGTEITGTLDYASATKGMLFGDYSASNTWGGETHVDYINYLT